MDWLTSYRSLLVRQTLNPWSITYIKKGNICFQIYFLSLEYDYTSENNITWAASELEWRHYRSWARIARHDLFPSSNGIRRFNPIFVATWGSFCKTWSRFMKWASSEGLEVPEALWNSQRGTHSAGPAHRGGPEKQDRGALCSAKSAKSVIIIITTVRSVVERLISRWALSANSDKYLARFSASEHTHCALVGCDSESVIIA